MSTSRNAKSRGGLTVRNDKQPMNAATDKPSSEPSPSDGAPTGLPTLTLVEKRSLIYARLPAADKLEPLWKPNKVVYIPYATMAWIEHLLKKNSSDWPWFQAVLAFVNSAAYERTKTKILSEIHSQRMDDAAFWERLRNKPSAPVEALKPNSVSRGKPKPTMVNLSDSLSTARRLADNRPYFWETIDPSWWREQP